MATPNSSGGDGRVVAGPGGGLAVGAMMAVRVLIWRSGLLEAVGVRGLLWPMSGADLLRHRSGDSVPALVAEGMTRGRADS